MPNDVDEATREAIQCGLSDEIHVGVRPLTVGEWRELLESAGLTVVAERMAPMHLLEPMRIVRDEGWLQRSVSRGMSPGTCRTRRRVLAMRRVFRKYRDNWPRLHWWPRNLKGRS